MPRPCTVCAHPQRADIDKKLALQVVNVRSLARQYDLGHDAVSRHRAKHLPSFLPALTARAEAFDLDVITAEAQRLYLTALDALAAAEAGVLAEVTEDGHEVRVVSSTAVARLLREARGSLDLLAKLSVAQATDARISTVPAGVNAELDSRIAQALDRLATRALDPPHEVLDVVAEEEPMESPRSAAADADRAGGPTTPTQGPGPNGPGVPRAIELPLESDAPTSVDQGNPSRGTGAEQQASAPWEITRALIVTAAAKRGINITPAWSRDEIKGAGFDVDAFHPDFDGPPSVVP